MNFPRTTRRSALVWSTLALIGICVLILNLRSSNVTSSADVARLSGPNSSPSPDDSQAEPAEVLPLNMPIEDRVRFEASRVGRLDNDSDGTDARLDALVEQSSRDDLKSLVRLALERTRAEDERFLAADLLARSRTTEALPFLEQVVLDPFEGSDDSESTKGSIEWALRARAIEGFERIALESGEANARTAVDQSLRKVLEGATHRFLLERAGEVRAQINNDGNQQARRLEDEDKEKLKGVLEKGAR